MFQRFIELFELIIENDPNILNPIILHETFINTWLFTQNVFLTRMGVTRLRDCEHGRKTIYNIIVILDAGNGI